MKMTRSLLGVWCGLLVSLLGGSTTYAEIFSKQLSVDEQAEIGLDKLTANERAALFAAIKRYKETGAAAAVAEAEKKAEVERVEAVEVATNEAVNKYKNREEPGVIAKPMELSKRQEAEKKQEQERFTSVLQGKFRGWEGNTSFFLDNGQVWRQSGDDRFYPKTAENVPVVVYKSKSGYYRLQILDDKGAWVAVKRVR